MQKLLAIMIAGVFAVTGTTVFAADKKAEAKKDDKKEMKKDMKKDAKK